MYNRNIFGSLLSAALIILSIMLFFSVVWYLIPIFLILWVLWYIWRLFVPKADVQAEFDNQNINAYESRQQTGTTGENAPIDVNYKVLPDDENED